MWEAGFLWNKVRSGALLWGATIAGVLLFGGIRLVLSGPVQAVVQAGCVVSSPETHGKPDSAVLASYLERTAGLARAGVKIVSWDEGGICVDQDAEARFVGRAQELVRRERIYLLIGLAVRDPEGRRGHAVNKVAFIDTSGAVVFEHRKYLRLPGEYFSSGDPELRVVRTPYGTLTAAICMDLDDPCYIRQATRLNADILLAPSYDWKEIDPIHTHMASFRSVENGFSLMRATCEGMSAAYDPYGRTLATADYFSSNAASLICFVPTASVDTVYEQTGDAFAWLCITGFLVLLAVAIVGPRKADQRSI
jgi:apolipoprotein N-acyltransferase